MLDVERTIRLREQAINLVPETIDSKQGIIKASSDGRYAALYARDGADSLTQSLSHPENDYIPGLLKAGVKTIRVLNLHRGQRSVAETEEYKGRVPHEVWTEDSPQDRLAELQEGGLPVRVNPENKRLSLVNYFGADTTPKLNSAIKVVAEAIDAVYSPQDGDQFLQEMWPHIEAGLRHDINNADKYGLGVIVTDPRNNSTSFTDGFLYQSWRDGVGAYIGDEERAIKPPFILFSNVCHYIKSLENSAGIADRLGYTGIVNDLRLRERAELARQQLDKLFWMEDEEYYAPLVDKNGPVKFISCDPIDGLYCGVLRPDRARMVVERLTEPDMLTRRYGLRTRSSRSPKYIEEGFEAYQNGAIWPHRNTMAALGMIQYGFIQEAVSIIAGVENYIEERGFSELAICTKEDERLIDYSEPDKNGMPEPKAPKIQSFFLYGYLGVSAWVLRQANWDNQAPDKQIVLPVALSA